MTQHDWNAQKTGLAGPSPPAARMRRASWSRSPTFQNSWGPRGPRHGRTRTEHGQSRVFNRCSGRFDCRKLLNSILGEGRGPVASPVFKTARHPRASCVLADLKLAEVGWRGIVLDARGHNFGHSHTPRRRGTPRLPMKENVSSISRSPRVRLRVGQQHEQHLSVPDDEGAVRSATTKVCLLARRSESVSCRCRSVASSLTAATDGTALDTQASSYRVFALPPTTRLPGASNSPPLFRNGRAGSAA